MSSFKEATKNILQEIGFTDFLIGDRESGTQEEIRMIAAIGLVGDIKGHFVLKIGDTSVAAFVKSLSSHLEMHNEDPHDLKYRKSVLGEIANQIGGRATVFLAENGIECMITPPTVIIGGNVETALPEADERLTFPVSGSFGHFRCLIALKKSKAI